MNESNVIIWGDYIDPLEIELEASLRFSIKAEYIEKKKIWKSKDITAEFLGNFWQNMLNDDTIKSTLHFICAELLENAVHHSLAGNYLVKIQLCFKCDELMIYVKNVVKTENLDYFKTFVHALLETENLQKLFIQRMKDAKKTGSKKSQVGLITIMKDRGAKLAWKLEQGKNETQVTTLARIFLNRKETI